MFVAVVTIPASTIIAGSKMEDVYIKPKTGGFTAVYAEDRETLEQALIQMALTYDGIGTRSIQKVPDFLLPIDARAAWVS